MGVINPKVARWFERRKISPEALEETGIYTGRWYDDEAGGKVVREDPAGDVIVFPYNEHGREVNAKYRSAGKRFSQRAGGRKTFFNADVLDDAIKLGATLIITEGEMDALSVITAGNKFAVSVPDGAPPARDAEGNLIEPPKGLDDIDVEHDDKYGYIYNNMSRLAAIKRIIIATDGDEPGRRLGLELAVRLDRVRCSFVTYPDAEVVEMEGGVKRPCKDFNEVLDHFGAAEVSRIIAEAKPYPLDGLYKLSEIPDPPEMLAVTTGFPVLDPHMKLHTPGFMVISGTPNQGKSAFANQLVFNLAMVHEWNACIISMEAEPKPHVRNVFRAFFLKKPKEYWTEADTADADAWIEKRFIFAMPQRGAVVDRDIDWLISKATDAVIRDGSKVILIDPWNEIDFTLGRENLTDYVGRSIKRLKQFSMDFDVLVIVVAHPSKEGGQKAPDRMTLYDISDSAHWFNKCDFGVMVARVDDEFGNRTAIKVCKIRNQEECGVPGTVVMAFNLAERRFQPPNEDPRTSPHEPFKKAADAQWRSRLSQAEEPVDDGCCPF